MLVIGSVDGKDSSKVLDVNDPPMASTNEGDFDSLWFENLMFKSSSPPKMLRYFSPDELLTLFGYETPHFHFPNSKNISNRKKFELIGNSLNVCVVKKLLKYLLITSNVN